MMKSTTPPLRKPDKTRKPGPSKSLPGKPFIHRYAFLLLILVPTIVYFKTISFDFTKLDDHVFIQENHVYNSHPGNVFTSFHRGLFARNDDVFYRPVLLADFILESQLFGTDPKGYHFTNILLHICCVLLLYLFLRKIDIPDTNALILSLVFAVHPILSQAVAWIPGRNDMLLVLFFFGCAILVIKYLLKPGWVLFTGQFLFLLLALFTKETGVIIPLILGILILLKYKTNWKSWLPLAFSWLVAILIWFFMRAAAGIGKGEAAPSALIRHAIPRLPALIQYLGKIFLPVNQSVFPSLAGTTYTWGILSMVALTALIILSKSYKKPLTIIGFIWYILFLIPVFMVPSDKNDQIFEHRLYLPIVGILLILSQTLLFKEKIKDEKKFIMALCVIAVFAIASYVHIDAFRDSLTFWNKAVEDNPGSADAKMVLGMQLRDPDEQEKVFKEAYNQNSHIRMLNQILGKFAMNHDQNAEAKEYFLKELKLTKLPETYSCLAHIYISTGMLDSGAFCLQKSIDLSIRDKGLKDDFNPDLLQEACHNLVLVYLNQNQKDKALGVISQMRKNDLTVPQDMLDLIAKP